MLIVVGRSNGIEEIRWRKGLAIWDFEGICGRLVWLEPLSRLQNFISLLVIWGIMITCMLLVWIHL